MVGYSGDHGSAARLNGRSNAKGCGVKCEIATVPRAAAKGENDSNAFGS